MSVDGALARSEGDGGATGRQRVQLAGSGAEADDHLDQGQADPRHESEERRGSGMIDLPAIDGVLGAERRGGEGRLAGGHVAGGGDRREGGRAGDRVGTQADLRTTDGRRPGLGFEHHVGGPVDRLGQMGGLALGPDGKLGQDDGAGKGLGENLAEGADQHQRQAEHEGEHGKKATLRALGAVSTTGAGAGGGDEHAVPPFRGAESDRKKESSTLRHHPSAP